jgi:zinc-ribbon domain
VVLALRCKRCGAEVSPGAKRCRVCGVSRPGTVLRASIVKPTVMALVWLVLVAVAYRLWH